MSKAAKETVREKPIALQLHDHMQQHKGCSAETCGVNAAIRESYRIQAQHRGAHNEKEENESRS